MQFNLELLQNVHSIQPFNIPYYLAKPVFVLWLCLVPTLEHLLLPLSQLFKYKCDKGFVIVSAPMVCFGTHLSSWRLMRPQSLCTHSLLLAILNSSQSHWVTPDRPKEPPLHFSTSTVLSVQGCRALASTCMRENRSGGPGHDQNGPVQYEGWQDTVYPCVAVVFSSLVWCLKWLSGSLLYIQVQRNKADLVYAEVQILIPAISHKVGLCTSQSMFIKYNSNRQYWRVGYHCLFKWCEKSLPPSSSALAICFKNESAEKILHLNFALIFTHVVASQVTTSRHEICMQKGPSTLIHYSKLS